jgi:glycosyltransferase involved in cell wall biosynthesis
MTYQMIVEGWRFLPHSYSIVNQFQCLELLKRKEIKLFHRDLPHYKDYWISYNNLFNANDIRLLAGIKPPASNHFSDVTLRIGFPFRFNLSNSKRTYIFITSEAGYVPSNSIHLGRTLEEAHRNCDVVLITCSNWSKNGLLRSGADRDRIAIVPLGIDPMIYKPLQAEERTLLRKQLGVNGFVFLSIGAMTGSKRIDLVLRAFAKVLEKHPEAKLILKGLDTMYNSKQFVTLARTFLTESEAQRVFARLTYVGDSLPFSEVAKLFQIADAYLSPYASEGFCLPVLEASACGLPVICTSGGATEDFTNADFALYINSQIVSGEILKCRILKSQIVKSEIFKSQIVKSPEEEKEDGLSICLDANLEHLIELMHFVIESDSFRKSAKIKGSEFVHQNFTWERVVDRLLNVLEVD